MAGRVRQATIIGTIAIGVRIRMASRQRRDMSTILGLGTTAARGLGDAPIRITMAVEQV